MSDGRGGPTPPALHDDLLASRVEDAGLNASAPPQQRWLDGWLLRLNPGKARRARCINSVAEGRQPLNKRPRRRRRTCCKKLLYLTVA